MDYAAVGLPAHEASEALAELRERARHIDLSPLLLLSERCALGVVISIGDPERELCDHEVLEGGARKVRAIPEGVYSKEDRVRRAPEEL
tara:strand:+ start:33 stop:299 length:267 start_codon:yes stop_codon:yes gene_type:complete